MYQKLDWSSQLSHCTVNCLVVIGVNHNHDSYTNKVVNVKRLLKNFCLKLSFSTFMSTINNAFVANILCTKSVKTAVKSWSSRLRCWNGWNISARNILMVSTNNKPRRTAFSNSLHQSVSPPQKFHHRKPTGHLIKTRFGSFLSWNVSHGN